MITNLLAGIVVTLVTNTSERFPRHLVADAPPIDRDHPEQFSLVYYGHWEMDHDPSEKWVRTTILRRTTLTFEWQGRREVSSDEVLSDTEQHFTIERKENWKPDDVPDYPRATNINGVELWVPK